MRRLVGPHRVEDFAKRDLGRRVLHISGRPDDHYAFLFSRRQLDELLWAAGTEISPHCFLIESGNRTDFPRKQGAELRDWLREGYRRGATLIVNHLERRSPSIARYQRVIEDALDARTDVTAVLTPPGAKGLATHHPVDALVLQVEGAKRWRLRPPVNEQPLEVQTVSTQHTEAPSDELTLGAGDFLHLPRGIVHHAWTESEASLHLTFGVYRYRWVDYLEDLIEIVAQDDLALRRRVADEDGLAILERLRERAPKVGAAALALRRRRWVATSEPSPGGALTRELPPFDSGARFVKPAGTRCCVLEIGGRAAIEFSGQRSASLRGPSYIGPALTFIASVEGPFGLSSLPDSLSYEEKGTLVSRLVAEGCLEPEV